MTVSSPVRGFGFATSCALLILGAVYRPATAQQKDSAPKVDFHKQVTPIIKEFCIGCHAGKSAPMGLDFTAYVDEASALKGREVLTRIVANLRSGVMPPPSAKQPTREQRAKLIADIETTLNGDCKLPDPGRVTLRRLNRDEYNRTVRDLMGVDFKPADDFPADDVGYGFDNIGDVLSISPLLMEKYLKAAEQITSRAIILPGVKTIHFDSAALPAIKGAEFGLSGERIMTSECDLPAEYDFPAAGQYRLKAMAYGQQAGPEPTKMEVRLDGRKVQDIDVKAVQDKPLLYEVPAQVSAGKHTFSVAFVNDYYHPEDPDPHNRDRNLVVDYLEIEGPLGVKEGPNPANKLITTYPIGKSRAEATKEVIGPFASKAFRRPVTAEELARLVKIAELTEKEGDSYERGIQLAMDAVLCSPNFLFHMEVDPKPNDPKASRFLNDYELASRLSYFLWSSMPDGELTKLASEGKLHNPDVLKGQIDRMMKDPKSHALADNFATQWLQLRKLGGFSPAPQYAIFQTLKSAMVTETLMFFQAVVSEDRSILDFIDGKYTFLNQALAWHYGMVEITGPEFRRVDLSKNPERGGVLTQAAVLCATSNPTRTSPTKRGKWILENFLGTPPPPPPPGADVIKDVAKIPADATPREIMEIHRKDPMCASCHSKMDPLGFGLENYDAIGRWRTSQGDQKKAIDATGVLPDGTKFDGPTELKALLLSKKDQFARCVAEKMLTYALGRGVEPSDNCVLDDVVKNLKAHEYRFSTLISSIVMSDAFRKRRGDGGH